MYRVSRVVIVLVLTLFLASCGSGGKVSTQDKSVEYQSARKLPPLKKPSPVVSSVPAEANEGGVEESPTSGEVAAAQSLDPSADTLTQESDSTTGASSAVANTSTQKVEAQITNLRNNIARLTVASEFDAAWDYLTTRLARSSVTVFSRNKAAGRFAIGCAAFRVPDEGSSSRSGGWAIFNRGSGKDEEYCALSVSTARGNTVVSALDREGEEVGKAGAVLVFNEILNN